MSSKIGGVGILLRKCWFSTGGWPWLQSIWRRGACVVLFRLEKSSIPNWLIWYQLIIRWLLYKLSQINMSIVNGGLTLFMWTSIVALPQIRTFSPVAAVKFCEGSWSGWYSILSLLMKLCETTFWHTPESNSTLQWPSISPFCEIRTSNFGIEMLFKFWIVLMGPLGAGGAEGLTGGGLKLGLYDGDLGFKKHFREVWPYHWQKLHL